jgi:uncharacterized Zn finger protein (UPF0148 family)
MTRDGVMYCPFCGGVTSFAATGYAECPTGAVLSEHVAVALHDAFVAKSRLPSQATLPFRVGGTWFCPGCGCSMRALDGAVRCASCDRYLNEFIYELVELNPHVSVARADIGERG